MRAVLRQLSDGGAAVISARGGLRGRVHGDFLREAEVTLRSISVSQHNAEVSLRIPGCVDPLSSLPHPPPADGELAAGTSGLRRESAHDDAPCPCSKTPCAAVHSVYGLPRSPCRTIILSTSSWAERLSASDWSKSRM